jgi:uncharacterized membrane protein
MRFVFPLLYVAISLFAAWSAAIRRAGLLFGRRVPVGFESSAEARGARRRYLLRTAAFAVFGAALTAAYPVMIAPMMVATSIAIVVFYWREAEALRNLAPPAPMPGEVELNLAHEKLPLGWWIGFVPFLWMAAVCLYLVSQWDHIPERFPIHWGVDGAANGWATKSVRGVFMGPIIFGVIAVWMLGFGLAVWHGTRRSSPWRKPMVNMMSAVVWAMAVLLSAVSLLPLWGEPSPGTMAPVAVLFVILILGTIVYSLRLVRDISAGPEYTPDSAWHGGILYFNREDHALFVEKRVGIGLSMNFGNPLSWVFLLFPLLLPVILWFVVPR